MSLNSKMNPSLRTSLLLENHSFTYEEPEASSFQVRHLTGEKSGLPKGVVFLLTMLPCSAIQLTQCVSGALPRGRSTTWNKKASVPDGDVALAGESDPGQLNI